MALSIAASSDVFSALADPTRRAILRLLAHGERAVNDLVRAFSISQPAVSQHLRVLRVSGLVTVRAHGRHRLYRIEAERLREVADWIGHFERFWDDRLENLGRYLDRRAEGNAAQEPAP
jgi:DNA-binding transcriptional ArsR family regulator